MLTDGTLRTETSEKAKYGGYDVRINICIECEEKRKEILLRAIEIAFNVFDGDNKLLTNKRNIKYFESMKKRKIGLLHSNYMSSLEVSFEVVCDNTKSEIEVGLQKLGQLTTAIPELTFNLEDGTVIKAKIHNTNDFEEVTVEEEE